VCVLLTVNEESTGFGCCGWFLTVISWFLIGVTFPFSLCVCLRVSATELYAVRVVRGWIDPSAALGWVEIFQFSVGWVGSTTAKVLKKLMKGLY